MTYIIDDDAEVCRSLAMLLAAEGFDARTFASAESFIDSLPALVPGIILTDVRMPGMTGIELLAALPAHDRTDPVVVMTGHADVPLAVQALKGGAADFIEKPFVADAIVSAIRHCAAADQSEARRMLASLTKRELEVFVYLVDGATNKRIALELGISPRTVEIYRAKVMEKMQASSLSRLVRLGVEAGLGHDVSAAPVMLNRQV
ncbi:response regulator [Sphingomonas donggukensis]|uniref:Response regulator n=1 Tax=Sphingomonas donggukensis TaxID=2949093 RepID=A0ABY4TT43_9SPHN|nr:response regulator [Sphingomonas donggukensis]URW75575.1 response regulator [Sphingomonas donggukensis]